MGHFSAVLWHIIVVQQMALSLRKYLVTILVDLVPLCVCVLLLL